MSKKDPAPKESLIQKSSEFAFKNAIPLYTTFELTQSCNFSCSHCYNFDRKNKRQEIAPEKILKTPKILSIIEELAQAGALYLNLTGGEILLHPDLLKIISHAFAQNFVVRLKSNAALLTPKKAKELKTAGLSSMDITLYGADNVSYESFTDVKEGFSKTCAGINAAKEAGIDLHINILLHKGNFKDLKKMIDFCKDQELPYQVSEEITDRYDGSLGGKQNQIDLKGFEELLLGEFGDFFMANNTDHAVQCSCARSVCGISCTGEVYPCIGSPIPSGNLLEKSFQDIWNHSPVLNQIRGLKESDFKECQECPDIEFCSRSSGSAFVNTGNYTGCDPRFKELAQIRKKNQSKLKIGS